MEFHYGEDVHACPTAGTMAPEIEAGKLEEVSEELWRDLEAGWLALQPSPKAHQLTRHHGSIYLSLYIYIYIYHLLFVFLYIYIYMCLSLSIYIYIYIYRDSERTSFAPPRGGERQHSEANEGTLTLRILP